MSRVEQRIIAHIAAAFDVEPGYDDVYDKALNEALARGLDASDAYDEAERVADAWQVAIRAAAQQGAGDA